MHASTLKEVVNERWVDAASAVNADYVAAAPCRHIVMDDFLKPEVADFLVQRFPALEEMPTVFREPMSYKGQLSDINTHRPEFAGVFAALQSAEFRQMLSRISGIPDLLEDPILAGGGLHLSPKSGFLDVHVDANFHPYDKTLHRRLNLLIYLNPQWDAAWGGDFELWSDRGRRPHRQVKAVAPLFNRAMLFSTTRTSWHGVQSINCPPGQGRRSIALYYYTRERPPEEEYEDSSVIWYQPRSVLKSALYPVMNLCIALLKPYAKYLRRGVFDAARRK